MDKNDPVDFSFVDEYGYIELIFDEEQTPPGWKIIPIVQPCKVCVYRLIIRIYHDNNQLWQVKIDEFGSSNRPLPSSCQLEVYAVDNPDTVEHFVYPILLDGIDPQMTIKIHRKLFKNSRVSGIYMISLINFDRSLSIILVPVGMSQLQGASIKDPFSLVPVNTGIHNV